MLAHSCFPLFCSDFIPCSCRVRDLPHVRVFVRITHARALFSRMNHDMEEGNIQCSIVSMKRSLSRSSNTSSLPELFCPGTPGPATAWEDVVHRSLSTKPLKPCLVVCPPGCSSVSPEAQCHQGNSIWQTRDTLCRLMLNGCQTCTRNQINVRSVCILPKTWISLNLAGRVACWRSNLSCETSPVLSDPCQVSAVPRVSKMNSSPARGPFSTSVVMFRHQAQLKDYTPPSCWTARTLNTKSLRLVMSSQRRIRRRRDY
jgi:hypothetical protein